MSSQIYTDTSPQGEVRIGSDPENPDYTIQAKGLEDAREEVRSYAAQVAKEWGEPVTVQATDPSGTFTFQAYPDGTFQEPIPEASKVEQSKPQTKRKATKTAAAPAPKTKQPVEPAKVPVPVEADSPATPSPSWWTRLKAAFGSPAPTGPDPADLMRAEDQHAVARYWSQCRTITIANGKGGVGKTPTAEQLSAAFALAGAGPVLYLEMNITRGTGSWTTERSDRHNATVHDLFDNLGDFELATSQLAGFASYVHHQSEDKYDVLNADPRLLSNEQQISAEEFARLHEVLKRAYRLIIVDTGNDEGTGLWRAILNATDQLVVVSDTRIVSASTASEMLRGLSSWGGSYRTLAQRAVIAVNNANGKRSARALADDLGSMARAATIIPYDNALADSDEMVVKHRSLAQPTQDAYLHLAALIAQGLDELERQ